MKSVIFQFTKSELAKKPLRYCSTFCKLHVAVGSNCYMTQSIIIVVASIVISNSNGNGNRTYLVKLV